MINWDKIKTVLLDMDGTLLDLHYDNYFWLEYLPMKWAEARGLTTEAAKDIILTKINSKKGSLLWYCVDYWSDELEIDIMLLKSDLAHKIALRPHAAEFMQTLCDKNKTLVMVTNAHRKLISVKFDKTGIGKYFHRVFSSHDIGHPKEEIKFWQAFNKDYHFKIDSTVFIDDNLDVLRSAKRYGLQHLLAIAQPDSQGSLIKTDEFHSIDSFKNII